MGSKIYLSSPSTPATALTQDLYINNVNVGAVSYQTPIFVNLQDVATTPVTPISVSKPANVATVTLPTPAPAGVALLRPTPNLNVSTATYDTGWRAQNGWYTYTPPAYPAKYAQLDDSGGIIDFFKLKTALTVNGVTNTQRFVDLSGVQGWAALNNLNFAVLDKLTGLMYTRITQTTATSYAGFVAGLTTAYNYSIVINGNTYSDWFIMGTAEANLFFGNRLGSGNFNDPNTGLTIRSGVGTVYFSEITFPNTATMGYNSYNATNGNLSSINVNVGSPTVLWVHDAKNLIS